MFIEQNEEDEVEDEKKKYNLELEGSEGIKKEKGRLLIKKGDNSAYGLYGKRK